MDSLIKTEEQIELLRKSAYLVSETLAEVAKFVQPGRALIDLDRVAEQFIRDNGAVPSFKGLYGFPATLCLSVNDAVVHGIPDSYVLKDGDILSVDCGACKDGFHGDSAYSFAVGNVSEENLLLLRRTKESLFRAIDVAVAGNRIGDIGNAVQSYCESFGYGVVKDLCGHGIGANVHESPEVPNYGRTGVGKKLQDGMVICIEPMVNLGTYKVYMCADKWKIKTYDGKPSAHFEHQIVIRKHKSEVLSSFDVIENVLNTSN